MSGDACDCNQVIRIVAIQTANDLTNEWMNEWLNEREIISFCCYHLHLFIGSLNHHLNRDSRNLRITLALFFPIISSWHWQALFNSASIYCFIIAKCFGVYSSIFAFIRFRYIKNIQCFRNNIKWVTWAHVQYALQSFIVFEWNEREKTCHGSVDLVSQNKTIKIEHENEESDREI